jgi:hypothetical protein
MPAKRKSEISASSTKEKTKRTYRTAEERSAEVDRKIQFHQKAIELLETKKAKVGTGRLQCKLLSTRFLLN